MRIVLKLINDQGVDTEQNFDAGAVYVYTRSGTTWSHQAYIKPENTDQGDQFGEALSLSNDGNRLAVSSIYEDSAGVDGKDEDDCGWMESNCALNSGAVYVFKRVVSAWTQRAYIKADNTGSDDWFGSALALSGDGNALIVGAIGEDSDAVGVSATSFGTDQTPGSSGAAYLYRFSADKWGLINYLKAPHTGEGDEMGRAVAITDNGGSIAVGAIGESNSHKGLPQTGVELTDDGGAQTSGAVYLY